MSRPNCTYFEVVNPFRYYRARGLSLSNSYIGSSQISSAVYDAVNAKPGSTFHCLPGGLFIVDADGVGRSAVLSAPKPPFEKSYTIYTTDEVLLGMQKRGLLREAKAPAGKPDYNAMSAASQARLKPLMNQIYEIEPSPEMQKFKSDMESVIPVLAAQNNGDFEVQMYDHTLSPTVGARVMLKNGGNLRLEWCYLPDFYRITGKNVSETSPFFPLLSHERPTKDDVIAACCVIEPTAARAMGR